jgi:hypothetical protein
MAWKKMEPNQAGLGLWCVSADPSVAGRFMRRVRAIVAAIILAAALNPICVDCPRAGDLAGSGPEKQFLHFAGSEFYVGPEVQGFAFDDNYRQFRAGLHLTAFKTESFEWTLAASAGPAILTTATVFMRGWA